VALWEIVLVGVAVAAGSWVQAGAGFGAALLATPIATLVEPELVPGPMVVGLGTLTVLMAVRERRHVDVRRIGWAVAGSVPGVAAGALAAAHLPAAGLDVGFGVLLLALLAASARGVRVAVTPRSLAVGGAASGLSGAATALSGPPMALLLQHQPGARLRADLSVLLTVAALLSVGALAGVGELGRHELVRGALLSVPAAAGFLASGHAVRTLDAGRTRVAVLGVSGLAAGTVLVRGLAAL